MVQLATDPTQTGLNNKVNFQLTLLKTQEAASTMVRFRIKTKSLRLNLFSSLAPCKLHFKITLDCLAVPVSSFMGHFSTPVPSFQLQVDG